MPDIARFGMDNRDDRDEYRRRGREYEKQRDEWKQLVRHSEKPEYWRGEVSKRVAWTETLNLDTDKPRQAARRMAATASYSQELKRQKGIPAGGRKLEKPACHYTLSWKEGETPARREMIKAAKESLAVLKMGDRQAVVVAHKDGKSAHVHVIVNRVSLEDGRAAKLSQSRLHLSRWAERWERARGQVQCRRRVKHNRIRSTGKAVYDRESRIRDQAHHRSPKNVSLNRFTMSNGKNEADARYVARFRVVERDMAQKAVDLQRYGKAKMLARHRQEWSRLYARQRDEKSRVADIGKRAVRAVTREISMSREEQAIGQAVGRAVGAQLSKISSERSGAGHLEARHATERRELGERQMGERDALLERAQVDFYEKPMKAAQDKYFELDLSNDLTAREYKAEMQAQGFRPVSQEHDRGLSR